MVAVVPSWGASWLPRRGGSAIVVAFVQGEADVRRSIGLRGGGSTTDREGGCNGNEEGREEAHCTTG